MPDPGEPGPGARLTGGTQLTFTRRMTLGFGLIMALAVSSGLLAISALHEVVGSKDRVIQVHARAHSAVKQLMVVNEETSNLLRGYLLTGSATERAEIEAHQRAFEAQVAAVADLIEDAEAQRLLADVRRLAAQWDRAANAVAQRRQSGEDLARVAAAFETEVMPPREALGQAVDALAQRQAKFLEEAREAASRVADTNVTLLVGLLLGVALLGGGMAAFLTRSLGRQIGAALTSLQSSSAELQAAANQQASSSREQASAMSEIATTINELLATSRQIALSAQRVVQIAGETSDAARSGQGTVARTREGMAQLKQQMEQVVAHMLELGRKSQQIGTVLDIVGELAEQTNILSINASIEAAGAGEAGKRFAVVAEEIRKLSDRVGSATKEIRAMIEDVRGAVNTTVMATETGFKQVEAGSAQVGEVAASFERITARVATTNDAAREIELSTKQQATAVEQVNVAIANVAQATRENEVSSAQTLETASQMAHLSRELQRLVEPGATRDAAGWR